MATVWLTYAWEDNEDNDVDFAAQELEAIGVTVKLDRWNLQAGRRLWEQIADYITDPGLSDAWVLYATPNSLSSEPCKEEFAYALGRALRTRGQNFPVIALFPSPVDDELIPPGIGTRLYVSMTDLDWKERIKAAAEGRSPSIERPQILPYALQVHKPKPGSQQYSIEVRPRAGTWAPFFAAVPIAEKDGLNPGISYGPKGRRPKQSILFGPVPNKFPSDDGEWWMMVANNEASPSQSYFISCNGLPSEIVFGVFNGQPQYRHKLTR